MSVYPHYRDFTITLRHTTLGGIPLDKRSQRDKTSMPLAEIEPAIPANEQLQTHTLDRAVTRIGTKLIRLQKA